MTQPEWDIQGTQPTWTSDFAPPQPKRLLRGWDRAPVLAHATRLQGKSVWKKPETRVTSRQYDENEAQVELEKEGLGARKKAKKAGAKENISVAAWQNQKEEEEDIEAKVALAPNKFKVNMDVQDAMSASIPSSQMSRATFDLPDPIPRKRYNNRNVVTPRKGAKLPTSKSEAHVSSTSKDESSTDTRPKKAIRRSLRQSGIVSNIETSHQALPEARKDTSTFEYTMDVPLALPYTIPEVFTPRRSQRTGRFGNHTNRAHSKSPCKKSVMDALLMSDDDVPPTIQKAKLLELESQRELPAAAPQIVTCEVITLAGQTDIPIESTLGDTDDDIVATEQMPSGMQLELSVVHQPLDDVNSNGILDNDQALFEAIGCTPSKVLATAASSAADKLSSPIRQSPAKEITFASSVNAMDSDDVVGKIELSEPEETIKFSDNDNKSNEVVMHEPMMKNGEALGNANLSKDMEMTDSQDILPQLDVQSLPQDLSIAAPTTPPQNTVLGSDEHDSSPSQQLHLELSLSPSKTVATESGVNSQDPASEVPENDGERDSLSLLANIPKLSYDPEANHDEIYLSSFLSRVKEAKKTGPKRRPSLPPHSPIKIPLETTRFEEQSSSPTSSGFDSSAAPDSHIFEPRASDTALGSPSKRRRVNTLLTDSADQTPRRSGRTRLPMKSGIPLVRGAQSTPRPKTEVTDPEGPIASQRNKEKDLATQTRVNTQRNKGASVLPENHLVCKAPNTIEQPQGIEVTGKFKNGLRQKTLGEYQPKKASRGLRLKWTDDLVEIREFNWRVAIPEKAAAPKVELAVATGSQVVEKKANDTAIAKPDESSKGRMTRPSRIAKLQTTGMSTVPKSTSSLKGSKTGK